VLLFFVTARSIYVTKRSRPWSAAVPWLQRLLERKYYFDELYDAVFVRTMDAAADSGDQLLEEPVLDGAPTDVGMATRAGAGELALTQNGFFRTYILVFVGGAAIALMLILLVRATS